MQKVTAIQTAREQRHFAARMADAKIEKKQQARVEIEKSIELLAPAVASREQVMRNVVDLACARIAARKKTAVKQLNKEASKTAKASATMTGSDQMEE